MTARSFNVLFLCTGNSARSILAERLVEHWGKGRFRGFSAGSHPKGAVHPLAIKVLRREGLDIEGLRSKNWDEFAKPGAPAMDFIVTVCDNAAGEACPVWPGRPATAHWGVPDPAAATGSEAERLRAFDRAFRRLSDRIERFTRLDFAALDQAALKRKLDEIGRLGDGATEDRAS